MCTPFFTNSTSEISATFVDIIAQWVPTIEHLECGDVAADVDGMPTGECRVRGRAFGDRDGEEEGLLAACVHCLVVHFHSVEQLLQASTRTATSSVTWQNIGNVAAILSPPVM